MQIRPDIAAAMSRMGTKIGAGKELRALPSELWPTETVMHLTSGTYSNGNGLLVVTDARILFLFMGVIRSMSEDFRYDRISSIEYKGGMLLATITVYVSNQKAVIQNVEKSLAKRIVDEVRATIHNPQTPYVPVQQASGPAVAPPIGDSVADQLLKLKQLLDAGVLSQAEYDQKRSILIAQL